MQKQEVLTDNERFASWQGPGWYAPHAQGNVAVWYPVPGDNPSEAPDTYSMGLGTPHWFDSDKYEPDPAAGMIQANEEIWFDNWAQENL